MKKVYICSPCQSYIDKKGHFHMTQMNINNAENVCESVIRAGHMPMCPHAYFTRFLDDNKPEERKKGLQLGLKWLEECEEIWVIGDYISEGMREEIDFATQRNMPIFYRELVEPKRR